MIFNIIGYDLVTLEHALIPVKLPDLHSLAFLLKIDLVRAITILKYGLHEHDVATGLNTTLHTIENLAQRLSIQIAKTPDSEDAVVVGERPFEVLDVDLVLRHILGHERHHLL